ncbi:hypothetical protein LJR034_004035 [Caballeronia sp. LjRoot34]|uniref:hypothetical protein n=1 Tax=Caballeronia sp. LjRoot34 TaxID=3342325 RepID=UPI003ED10482
MNLTVNEAQHDSSGPEAISQLRPSARASTATGAHRPGPTIENATLHARHANLLIFGQQDPADPATFIARHFLEDILMGSGRPAILLPCAARVERFSDTVLIA